MTSLLAFVFVVLVAVSKTVLFRFICARKTLDAKKNYVTTWLVSIFVSLIPMLILIPCGYLGMIYGGLGNHNGPHTTALSNFLTALLVFPIYIAPMTTLVSIVIGFVILKLTKTNRPWYMMFAAYLALIVVEYLLIGLSVVLQPFV